MKQKQKKNNRWIILVSILIIGLLVIALLQKHDTQMTKPLAPTFKKQGELTFTKASGEPIITIDIEIADTDEKREIGLMGRPTLGENEGMLFVFDNEHYASFWMKNTIIPLDMIFINKYGIIVTIHQNTTPFSEQSYTATAPTLLVLEVNAGFTEQHNINVGDKIDWHRIQ